MKHARPDSRFIRCVAKKLKCIEYLGGNCEKCSRDLCEQPWLAQFHHRIPDEKSFGIMLHLSSSMGMHEIQKELDKCQLLCGHCHIEHHFGMDKWKLYKDEIISRKDDFSFEDSHHTTESELEAAQAMADEGHTLGQIAEQTGRCLVTLSKHLNGNFGNDRSRKITDEQLIAEKQNGLSHRDIALKYGMTYKVVWKRWRRINDAESKSLAC